jgi:hypothetical protein
VRGHNTAARAATETAVAPAAAALAFVARHGSRDG